MTRATDYTNAAQQRILQLTLALFGDVVHGYLLLLKEGCDHGEFTPVLERLGINPQAASRYMGVTKRFANLPTSANLEKLGFSKMAELLPLDDSQLENLVDEGQTGELDLDDVSRMSVKELRAAVRKERSEAAKQKNRAERQEAVNAEMHEEVRQIKRLPAADLVASLRQALAAEYDKHMQIIAAGYPTSERESWPVQTQEARALAADAAAATPWIDAAALARGLDRKELAQRICAKDDAYRQIHGALTGTRQRIEDQIPA